MSVTTAKRILKGRSLLLLGVLLSLAVHGLVWQLLQKEKVNEQTQMAPSYAAVRVSVSRSAISHSPPQKVEQTQPKTEPKPVVPKIMDKKAVAKKTASKKPVDKQISPLPNKAPQPQPIVKPVVTKQSTNPKTIETDTKQLATPVVPTAPVPVKTSTPLLSEAERKNKLIAELMRRIDQNKHYPKRALKRGIEGRVRFTLVLDRAGQLQKFEWLEGNRLFYKSTLDAVKRSLPLKLSTEQSPLNHQLALQYQIRR